MFFALCIPMCMPTFKNVSPSVLCFLSSFFLFFCSRRGIYSNAINTNYLRGSESARLPPPSLSLCSRVKLTSPLPQTPLSSHPNPLESVHKTNLPSPPNTHTHTHTHTHTPVHAHTRLTFYCSASPFPLPPSSSSCPCSSSCPSPHHHSTLRMHTQHIQIGIRRGRDSES